jgi:phosphoribosylaminoimidazole-succinocarboxamide synthase
MKKGKLIYEGKAKKLYQSDDPELLIQEFKDDATAFNARKKGTISGKGVCNNKISARLFEVLKQKGVETHFVRLLSDREMLVKRLQIIPIEVTVRNIVAGGMAERFGLKEGQKLNPPVLEYHYKSDKLGDPLVNDFHIRALELASVRELETIQRRSFEINNSLSSFLKERKLLLVDFKLEFGKAKGRILLGDEISPDTCRFWEAVTMKKMDKDRFRRDLGGVEEVYQEVLKRITNN